MNPKGVITGKEVKVYFMLYLVLLMIDAI